MVIRSIFHWSHFHFKEIYDNHFWVRRHFSQQRLIIKISEAETKKIPKARGLKDISKTTQKQTLPLSWLHTVVLSLFFNSVIFNSASPYLFVPVWHIMRKDASPSQILLSAVSPELSGSLWLLSSWYIAHCSILLHQQTQNKVQLGDNPSIQLFCSLKSIEALLI